MRPRILLVCILLIVSQYAGAQNDYKSFSLEAGTGIQPIRMWFAVSSLEDSLVEKGQVAKETNSGCPTFSLSEVLRLSGHWELVLSESVSWKYYNLRQYDTFGIDPNGQPRYDLSHSTDLGRKARPSFALYFQGRLIWSPKWKLTCYSALGLGASSTGGPAIGITPVGMRYGGKHLYGFAELTVSPLATLGHGGIGWRF